MWTFLYSLDWGRGFLQVLLVFSESCSTCITDAFVGGGELGVLLLRHPDLPAGNSGVIALSDILCLGPAPPVWR